MGVSIDFEYASGGLTSTLGRVKMRCVGGSPMTDFDVREAFLQEASGINATSDLRNLCLRMIVQGKLQALAPFAKGDYSGHKIADFYTSRYTQILNTTISRFQIPYNETGNSLSVRLKVARYSASPEVLRAMKDASERKVLQALVHNLATPLDVVAEIGMAHRYLAQIAACHPSMTQDVFRLLVERWPNICLCPGVIASKWTTASHIAYALGRATTDAQRQALELRLKQIDIMDVLCD